MQTDNEEYRTVVLAGLLHDIGKLLQRGFFGGLDIKGKHPVISANYVTAFTDCFSQVSDASLLKTLVQKHHENYYFESELNVKSISDVHVRTLATLVSLADNLSSAERAQHFIEYQDYKKTPIVSVLERVNNSELAEPVVRFHSNPLSAPEKLLTIFPEIIQTYNKGGLTQFIKTTNIMRFNIWSRNAHYNRGPYHKKRKRGQPWDAVMKSVIGMIKLYRIQN